MRSMTGYGRGAAERSGRRATVEVRSVNHRFLDIKLRGAALDPGVEEQVSARIRETAERGAITLTVHLERRGPGAAVRVDRAAARAAHAALVSLAEELGTDPPTLALVVAQPGVVLAADDADDSGAGEAVLAAADDALAQLFSMRAAEGAILARDFQARLAQLAQHIEEIATLAGAAPDEARRKLHDRVSRLLDGETPIDPARLAQEVAILADKSDVTEELVRARSHVEQLRTLSAGGSGAIGRRLDFLVQEMGRELNTMGAKSSAIEIVRRVVAAKAELEKIREQVQNVE